MAKQAKIVLSADVSKLKEKTEEAKRLLLDLGETKISDKNIKTAINSQLESVGKEVKTKISELEDGFKRLGDSTDRAFDHNKARQYVTQIASLKRELREISTINKSSGAMASIGKGAAGVGGAVVRGGGASGIGSGILSMLRRHPMGAAIGAVGLGAVSAYRNQSAQAEGRLQLRALTGGVGELDDVQNNLGFTQMERISRATQVTTAAGREMGQKELQRAEELTENITRGRGIGIEQQAAAMTASRKAGGGDGQKFLVNAIGSAVGAGMEGSKIGEYLQEMTGLLTELSEGVNIDQEALVGFAGVLGRMPFFSDDPRRAGSAIRTLEQTFSQGDRFQQALVARAIQRGVPSAQPTSIEIRRNLGLFADTSGTKGGIQGGAWKEGKAGLADRIEKLGGGDLAKVLKMSPQDIIGNMFTDVMELNKGRSFEQQLYAFQEGTGMKRQGGAEIFTAIKEQMQAKPGISINEAANAVLTPDQIKDFKKSQMTEQERAEDMFQGVEARVKTLTAAIDRLTSTISRSALGGFGMMDAEIPGVSGGVGAIFGGGDPNAPIGASNVIPMDKSKKRLQNQFKGYKNIGQGGEVVGQSIKVEMPEEFFGAMKDQVTATDKLTTATDKKSGESGKEITVNLGRVLGNPTMTAVK